MEDFYCWWIFCSRFHTILSPLKLILEMVFWTNLMLDLICTWLEKTRRFCRQVDKKISSCFWTASTCVQKNSFRMMFTVDLYGKRGLDSRGGGGGGGGGRGVTAPLTLWTLTPGLGMTLPHWLHSYKMATYVWLYSLWDSTKFYNYVLTNK